MVLVVAWLRLLVLFGNSHCSLFHFFSLANAILLANDYCPLSYRSVDEIEYKKAVIIFYENNSLAYFKDLFIEQFNFAVDKYF